MELYNANSENMYNLIFSNVESENIRNAVNNYISLANIELMYFLENEVKSKFQELNGGRLMIMQVDNTRDYISVKIWHQNIDIAFDSPKKEFNILKICKLSFENESILNDTLKKDKYKTINIKTEDNGNITLNALNVKIKDLLKYSIVPGLKIEKVLDII